MRIRTVQKLSEHREVTPEGYLLCKGAALARTGSMRYLASEVGPRIMKGCSGNEALLYRDESEVFDPAAMASFEGKPLTLDHPDEDVAPDNWQELARGVVLNVRRGSGLESDLLLADILITDAGAIEAVKNGLCELSCGYDTETQIVRPGVGRQTRIRGNHVALVERGRAGARCRIGDTTQQEKGENMAKAKGGVRLIDRLKRLLKDAEAEENTQDEEQPQTDEGQEATQAATDEDMASELQEIKLMLRTLCEALKPAPDEEPAQDEEQASDEEQPASADDEPAEDEDAPCDEDPPAKQDARPSAFCDAATAQRARRMGLLGARPGDGADAVRRGALALAMRDADSAALVRDILGKTPLSRASAANVRAAFAAVAAIRARDGNSRTADALAGAQARKSGPMTPAQINKINSKFFGGK